jgi:CubicO group peptidase (beta-lactamase class C family)
MIIQHRASRRSVLLGTAASMGAAVLAGCDRSGGGTSGVATASPAGGAPPDLPGFSGYLKQQAGAGRFAGTVMVAKDGRPALTAAYGMADRLGNVANTAATRYNVASMGKMFTAVAIAQLVERAHLSFTDTIDRYIAGFPPEVGGKVTIHHLLTHTSGMGDEALVRRPDRTTPPSTLAAQLAVIIKAPLAFQPGSQHAYSNDGFIVLGAVIERVTGRSYADHVHDHVFVPAGMTETRVAVYKPVDVPHMAHGYMLVDRNGQPLAGRPADADPTAAGGELRDNSDVEQIANPSGGAYSTATDMIAFATSLTGGKLLNRALTDTVTSGKVATNRRGAPPGDMYAYGFADFAVNGVRVFGHNGGSPGYDGQLDIYPSRGYAVVILTNQDNAAKPAIARSEEVLTRSGR